MACFYFKGSLLIGISISNHNQRENYSLLIEEEAPLIRLQPLEVRHGVRDQNQHQPSLGLALGLDHLNDEIQSY